MNHLGLRIDHLDGGEFFDFVVDGQSLGELFAGDVTALWVDEDPEFRTENLRRLLGEDVPRPTFEPRMHRAWFDRLFRLRGVPVASHESAFDDGRVGIYYCRCSDMDCGVLSARIEFTATEVIWHEVGWQVTYDPFSHEQAAATTYVFEKSAYDECLRRLLHADWSEGIPQLR